MKTKVQSIKVVGGKVVLSYPKIDKKLVLDLKAYTPEVQAYMPFHGAIQRFGDLESGDKTGSAKFETATKLDAHYKSSTEWEMRGERDTVTEVIEAVNKVYPQFKVEDLQKAVAHDPDQVSDWRADAGVKVALAKARLAKAQEAVKKAPKATLQINLPA